MSDNPAFAVDVDLRLQQAAREHANSIAISIGAHTLSWGEFDRQVNRIANALIARGLVPADRIAALGNSSLSYLLLIFGVLRSGGCIVPLQTLSSEDDLVGMIRNSGAKLLFVSSEFASHCVNRRAEMPMIGDDGLYSLGSSVEGVSSFEDFLEDVGEDPPSGNWDPESGACLVYSSGTTGIPKGILQSRALKAQELKDMAQAGLSPETNTLIATPLCSSTTLFILISALGNGGSVTVMEKFDVEQFLSLSEKQRITHTILVPVQYERILSSPSFAKYDLSSYQTKISIGAPLRRATKLEILRRWPQGGLIEFYGMTEGGPSCVLFAHERQDKLDTVGKPADGCDLRVIDEDGVVLPPGETGEVIGRSPRMMLEYWGRPDETKRASWHDENGNRFHKSGDVGWLDDEGFLHLVDRKKDMIISGGFNIYAADLESVVCDHPDVLEAAVIGTTSERWGEEPIAFVTLKKTASAGLQDIQQWANERLGKVQRLSGVFEIDELPRNANGKVLKRQLRKSTAINS